MESAHHTQVKSNETGTEVLQAGNGSPRRLCSGLGELGRGSHHDRMDPATATPRPTERGLGAAHTPADQRSEATSPLAGAQKGLNGLSLWKKAVPDLGG